MLSKANAWLAAAALCVAVVPAGAQTVYKCGPRSYSQMPCSKRIVNTADAPVPAKANASDARRLEANRAVARSLRRLPGESAQAFRTRQRRAALLESDREECARLDTRIPVEQSRLGNPSKDEVREAELALAQSRKRFRQLRC